MTLAQKLRLGVLGLAGLVGAGGLYALYDAGRAVEAIELHPPLSRRQVRQLTTQVAQLQTTARQATRQRDSVVARATTYEAHAARLDHEVDSLSQHYAQVPAAVARATDDELYRFLADYHPSPFPDTSFSASSGSRTASDAAAR